MFHIGASAGKPPLSVKILYGSGQGVDAATQVGLNTFLLYYLTAVCGFSGSAAGLVFFLSLTLDALLDPLIGRTSDRYRSRWGRRLPFMAAALVPMAGSAFAIFSIPEGLGEAGLFLYVLLFNVALRLALSIFALPYAALTAELSDDYGERSAISGFRALFIFLGTLACLIPGSAVILSGDKLQSPDAYRLFGAWLALLILLFGTACLAGIRRTVLALPTPPVEETSPRFVTELANLVRNAAFVRLFAAAVLVLVGQGITLALNIHAFRYFWHVSADQLQLPLMVLVVGQALGLPVAGLLLRVVEKRSGIVCAVIGTAGYTVAITLLALAGALPIGTNLSLALLVANAIILGAASTLFVICLFSMMADAVDEHDYLFGVRREALYAAALMLGIKAATGIGGFVAGVGLQFIGFSAQGPANAAGQPPFPGVEAINHLGLLWGALPSLLLFSSLPLLLRYPVTRTRHAFVIEELDKRASGAAAQGQ
ncbi:MFS transporter [Sphingopyxis panaciterrulae]|uniref:GPH family glycoside/pentoside/hexuronide:cation symporter n=1 Tax=Sphingopyxis panaciterrulae TaxID=462372 RepID=A0A7W9EQK7_9SPHN|nr:MFS transporter [Sphingopyxis panaciterrulae]MBB5705315.1 GPH family glycoside/pentoside/hexuronide:cation symporter [Sphingopyxis panaciterrulae]